MLLCKFIRENQPHILEYFNSLCHISQMIRTERIVDFKEYLLQALSTFYLNCFVQLVFPVPISNTKCFQRCVSGLLMRAFTFTFIAVAHLSYIFTVCSDISWNNTHTHPQPSTHRPHPLTAPTHPNTPPPLQTNTMTIKNFKNRK